MHHELQSAGKTLVLAGYPAFGTAFWQSMGREGLVHAVILMDGRKP